MAKGKPFLRGRGKCIFCKRSPPQIKMTGEHIWSDWLKTILFNPGFRTERADGLISKDGKPLPDVPVHRKPGAVHRRQAKIVCNECNGGWMKAIVDAARTPAETLIRGKPVVLNKEEQTALASWMGLSAIVVNQETRTRHKLPEADIDYMYRHHMPPPEWHIEIGRYLYGHRSDFSDNQFAFSVGNPATNEYTTLFVAHSTATILGYLYIKFYCGDKRDPGLPSGDPFPGNLHRPYLIPIWPHLFPNVPFPPPANFFIPGILTPKGGFAYDLNLRVRDYIRRAFEQAGLGDRSRP
jgi:hypothetical protein